MMNRFLLTIIFIVRLFPSWAQGSWKLATETDGIKVYTSILPDSKIKAVKVTATFNATPAQLAAVLLDINATTEWIYHTKSAVMIKQVTPSELYYYSEISLPWPAANRDFVAHLTVKQDPQTKVITIDGPAVAGMVPLKEGIVRVNDSKGKWVITPITPGQVRVEYAIHVDPGGSLPAWLVNMFATEGPLKIFRNLREQIHKHAYKDANIAFADNK